MVVLGVLVLDVLLEDDHVAVGNLLALCRRQDGSCVVVDGANLEHGRGRGQRRQRRHGEGVLHGGGGGLALRVLVERESEGEMDWEMQDKLKRCMERAGECGRVVWRRQMTG